MPESRKRNYPAAARNLAEHYARLAPQLARLSVGKLRQLGPVGAARWAVRSLAGSRPPEPRPYPARVALALSRLEAAAERPPVWRRKPRLAMVTPFPPDRTGIANYAADLAQPLSQYYDVTIVAASAARQPRAAPFPVESEAWFDRRAGEFDRVLYHFGNAPFHAGMAALLKRHPGVAVLHDFGLGDLAAYLQASGRVQDGWARALYDSHGYAACEQLARRAPAAALAAELPCSAFVFAQAQGVLVHSRYARKIARSFYGEDAAERTAVIPFLQRALPLDRASAREALGLGEGELLVCSFGFIAPTKLTDRVVDVWVHSGLAARGRLALVGQAPKDAFGRELAARIARHPEARIHVTGFTDRPTFELYLAAADVAIQLRAASRGETSGAVFDCLAAGLPTVINAHAALAEIPANSVWMLPDRFEDEALAEALRCLAVDEDLRRRLGARGRALVEADHAPELVAQRYRDVIEHFAGQACGLHDPTALAAEKRATLAAPAAGPARVEAARRLAQAAGPRPGRPCLFVDVTAIAAEDLHTGVQRVVRAQLLQLLRRPPDGFRVEPVRIVQGPGEPHLRHARAYASSLLGLPRRWLADEPVELRRGDVYYMPDLAPDLVPWAAEAGLYRALRAAGVAIHFMVHDVLPLEMPERFPPGAAAQHARWLEAVAQEADQLICISDAVRVAVRGWLSAHASKTRPGLRLSRLHHGADIEASAPSRGRSTAARAALSAAQARPTFLMVGTVEPRKGYEQVLPAFAALWERGVDVNLVIVGSEGWRGLPRSARASIPSTVEALRTTRESGRRLFWVRGASDAALKELFAASSCLLAASWGEGFGLPLIEAARHGLPVLARDLPVFREVAGDHAAYFEASTPEDLAQALHAWLQCWKAGEHPRPHGMPFLTWAENAERLKALLTGSESDRRPSQAEGAVCSSLTAADGV